MKKVLFAALTALVITMLFSACNKEADQLANETTVDFSNLQAAADGQKSEILLPDDLDANDQQEIEAYLTSLSAEEAKERMEGYKILEFLKSTGNLEARISDNPNLGSINRADLVKYAPRSLDEFEAFVPAQEERNGCSNLTASCSGPHLVAVRECCYFSHAENRLVCVRTTTIDFYHPVCSNPEPCGGGCPSGYTCTNNNCVPVNTCNCPPNYDCWGGVCELECGGNTGIICP